MMGYIAKDNLNNRIHRDITGEMCGLGQGSKDAKTKCQNRNKYDFS